MSKDALLMAKICELSYLKKTDQSPDVGMIKKRLKQINTSFLSVYGFNKSSSQAIIVEHPNYIVVAFRGSDEPGDWLKNIDLKKTKKIFGNWHAGFWGAVDVIFDQIKAKLNQMNQNKPLYITGHSLGGAMAQVFAGRCLYDFQRIQGIYTFGQPRVVDKATKKIFNQYLKESYFRYQNNNDGVCRVPGLFNDFKHVGTHIYITHKKRIISRPKGWIQFTDAILGFFESVVNLKIDPMQDHDIKKYIKAININRAA